MNYQKTIYTLNQHDELADDNPYTEPYQYDEQPSGPCVKISSNGIPILTTNRHVDEIC